MVVGTTKIKDEDVRICQDILHALGDENRQAIVNELLREDTIMGLRVNDIAKKANLSRPAVSRHLKILKDAGIVKVRKEGTKNYYYYEPNENKLELLVRVLMCAKDIALQFPGRSGRSGRQKNRD